MSVGIRVHGIVDLLGAPDFVKAFFSTVSANLEPDGWGSRFPALMGPLYQGELPAERIDEVRSELATIRSELSEHRPSDLVWDIEDRSARPPWGDDISSEITSLGNYFVTMEGKDLFEVLDEALSFAGKRGYPAELTSIGVTVGDEHGNLSIVDEPPGS